LDAALFGRGKAWMNCSPQFDAATGTVLVRFDQPHHIDDKIILNAFQGLDNPGSGRYMGEFKVSGVEGNNVMLTPTYTPGAARRALLQQAHAPWSLYEVLPADKNELFAGMSEEDIREMLPKLLRQQPGEANDDFQARRIEHEELVAEYLQDNKPIKPDDPPRWQEIMGTQVVIKFVKEQTDLNEQAKAALRAIDFGENLVKSGVVMKVDLQTAAELVRLGLAQEVERRYQRNLRDYSYILREFHRRLPLLEDQIANLQKDLDYLTQANQEADKHLAEARKKEADMQQELTLVNKERQVVGGFRDTLQERLDKTNAEIARLREENQRLAAQLARRQLEAVQGAGRSAAATALAAPSR
jgi:hypothetical protein